MAKQTILTERGTGEVMYPQTLASLVHTADGGNVEEGLEKAKFALFVDMWNSNAWLDGNKPTAWYDATSDVFYCNDIPHTYEEALICYAHRQSILTQTPLHRSQKTNYLLEPNINLAVRTSKSFDEGAFYGCSNLKVVRVSWQGRTGPTTNIPLIANVFIGSDGIETIIGPIGDSALKISLSQLTKLKSITVKGVSKSCFFNAPKLSIDSMTNLVSLAANTAAITITVHPDVYAKLTGDTTNEAAAALTPEELAAWQQVLADAVDRNISFATV